MILYCDVLLNTEHCELPVALEENDAAQYPPIRTKCYACGARACKNCSRRRRWDGLKDKRICNDCVGEYQDLMADTRQAGRSLLSAQPHQGDTVGL